MLVQFTKHPPAAPADLVTCRRADGSTSSASLPRQGVLPRLALRFVVEDFLGSRDALFGRVAAGAALDETLTGLTARGIALRQSEALAAGLEADQWGGAAAPAEFARRLREASRARGVSAIALDAAQLDDLRAAIREFGAAWRPLAAGQSLERTFAVASPRAATRQHRQRTTTRKQPGATRVLAARPRTGRS